MTEEDTIVKSLRFHKEIIGEFDKKIIQECGSIKFHRINVLEEFMKDYTADTHHHNQQIIEDQAKQIMELQQQLQQLEKENNQTQHDLDQYKIRHNDIQQTLQEKEERIIELKKEKTKWENEFHHNQALLEKRQEECNNQSKKLEKYSHFFGAVTHMSWWNRLLGNYPEEIKELQPPVEEQEKKEE